MAAAAVMPLLAYGAVSMYSLRTGAQETVVQGNLNVARQVSEQIESVRHRQRQDPEGCCRRPAANRTRSRGSRIAFSRTTSCEFPEFKELTLIDESGRPTIIEPPRASRRSRFPDRDSTKIDGVLMSRVLRRQRSAADRRSSPFVSNDGQSTGMARRPVEPRRTVADGRPHSRRQPGLCARSSPAKVSCSRTATRTQNHAWRAATRCGRIR